MNKTCALASALCAALASCVPPTAAVPNAQETALENYGSGLTAVAARYRESPLFHSCMANSVRLCETQAGQAEALQADDLAVCGALSDANVRTSCRAAVADARVGKDREIGRCRELPGDEADECLARNAVTLARYAQDPSKCSALEQAFAGRPQRAEYEYSMCVIAALYSDQGKDAEAWCAKIKHPDNAAHCRKIWKLEKTGSGSAAAR